ncbi:unnamed protein product, partial [Adineta steineri]
MRNVQYFFPLLIQSHVNKTELVSQITETYFPNEFHERRELYERENIEGASIPQQLTNSGESIIFEVPIL